MSMTEIISLIGIIVGLGLLVVLVMRGVNIYVVALSAAIVVALFGQVNLYDALTGTYMESFANFVKNYWLIFLTGSLMGKVYEITGGAKAIARFIVKSFGPRFAVISIPIACGILAYGGVSVYVVSFAVFPIALEIFHEMDLPRNYIPCALTFGCSTFAMVAPGAPQIQNAIPAEACGVNLMAGTVVGFAACGTTLVVGCIVLSIMVSRQKANGAHFVPKPMDSFGDEDEKTPPALMAFIPLVVCIVLINTVCHLESGVLLGAILALLLMWKYQDPKQLVENAGEVCKSSLNAICNTSSVVAFGGVVQLVPAFSALTAAMLNLPGPKVLSLAIATTILAGVCGSASGGCGIAAPLLGPEYIAMGVPAAAVSRTISISSAALDSLPHNGYIVTVCNGLCNETHKECYGPVFIMTVIVPAIGTIVAILGFTLFPNLP